MSCWCFFKEWSKNVAILEALELPPRLTYLRAFSTGGQSGRWPCRALLAFPCSTAHLLDPLRQAVIYNAKEYLSCAGRFRTSFHLSSATWEAGQYHFHFTCGELTETEVLLEVTQVHSRAETWTQVSKVCTQNSTPRTTLVPSFPLALSLLQPIKNPHVNWTCHFLQKYSGWTRIKA